MTILAQGSFSIKRANRDGYSCSLTSYSTMLNSDSNGVIGSLVAAVTTVKLYQGSTAVTPVISIDSVSNCSARISGLNVSIASVPNNTKSGYVDIKVVYGSFVKIERYTFTIVDYTIVKNYTQTIVGDQMTSYATKTTVDALGKTVSAHSTTIQQNSKDIALKASQSDVTALGNRMKSAEASITPDAINLTVKSQINTAVANVQIGGRNLLLNSKISKSGTGYNIGVWISSRDFVVGETLTVTIKGTISTSKLFGIWFNGGSYGGYPIPKVSAGIFSTAISVPSGTSNRTVGIYLIGNQSATDSWTFEWIKLEWGNKGTDWSPAPEDVDANINLRPTTDEIKASFTIDPNGVSLFGKKISLTGMVSFNSLSDYKNVNGRITTAQNTANTANNDLGSLTKKLGGLAYKAQVEQAMKDEGLISGGFLKMSLIDVKNVVTQGLSAQTIDAGNATIKNLNVDTIKMTNADVSGKVTAASGAIGHLSIDDNGLYFGDPSKWTTSTYKQDLTSVIPGCVRIQKQYGYFQSGDIANIKVGIGDGADPSIDPLNLSDCLCSGYFYRQMNYDLDPYYPAVRIISDNVVNRNVALELTGGLRVYGGVMETGNFMPFCNRAKSISCLMTLLVLA